MTTSSPRTVAESTSSTIDPVAQARHTTDGELSARFQSDVSPVHEPLYRHAMRMTRGSAPTARNRAGPSEVLVAGISERDLVASAARIPAGLRSAEADVLDTVPDNEIKAAMDALPECFRAAVYLGEAEGYTCAETGAMLGISHGTVMSRVSRSRKRLRIALAHVA